jgi:Zn-dependent M28 family amino/carboxypeptidase
MPEQLRPLRAAAGAAAGIAVPLAAPRTAQHTGTANLRRDRHRKTRNHTAPDSAGRRIPDTNHELNLTIVATVSDIRANV